MKTRFWSTKGFTVFETVVTLCLVGVLVGVIIPRYARLANEAREVALRTELTNIRLSIKLFTMLNNRYPSSLDELIRKEFMLPARTGPDAATGSIILKESYLMKYAVDRKGNIIDAYGNPFFYDPRKGEVKTTTHGHEHW